MIVGLRAQLSRRQRQQFSLRAARCLVSSAEWDQATTVALFLSTNDEIDTTPLLEHAWAEGKRTVVPVTHRRAPLRFHRVTPNTTLVRTAFGVQEPQGEPDVAYDKIDLVVVPGLAFDRLGGRLGHGGGYYDRTLPMLHGPKLMYAFALQQVDAVPLGPDDVCVDAVVTETGRIACAT